MAALETVVRKIEDELGNTYRRNRRFLNKTDLEFLPTNLMYEHDFKDAQSDKFSQNLETDSNDANVVDLRPNVSDSNDANVVDLRPNVSDSNDANVVDLRPNVSDSNDANVVDLRSNVCDSNNAIAVDLKLNVKDSDNKSVVVNEEKCKEIEKGTRVRKRPSYLHDCVFK
ncbi:hypothetical protein ABEB36_015397 [Hypothenemus hampei]|uniref:Uncharacterized protein n=1 Tax=Hypothenemus hampei TaxID=57062 RepID=A0ABD1E0C9_HYPHA